MQSPQKRSTANSEKNTTSIPNKLQTMYNAPESEQLKVLGWATGLRLLAGQKLLSPLLLTH
jgi:hypothetical protein